MSSREGVEKPRPPRGVILRSERGEAAAAQVSAGPKDLLADATRLGRGSVTIIEVAQRLVSCCCAHCSHDIRVAAAAALAHRRLDPSALRALHVLRRT